MRQSGSAISWPTLASEHRARNPPDRLDTTRSRLHPTRRSAVPVDEDVGFLGMIGGSCNASVDNLWISRIAVDGTPRAAHTGVNEKDEGRTGQRNEPLARVGRRAGTGAPGLSGGGRAVVKEALLGAHRGYRAAERRPTCSVRRKAFRAGFRSPRHWPREARAAPADRLPGVEPRLGSGSDGSGDVHALHRRRRGGVEAPPVGDRGVACRGGSLREHPQHVERHCGQRRLRW
ncbi:MAG: hypothetical protein JWO62_1085 [Acidimicrobiaceae bacterium]|jgi:hypothetical protein|nr:hypothetical protein [Acidimicrobiaceae bacterium]